ncbi:AI-2E family transporter [uncultured Gulosibacter sp.]|uniref:AI-2E family transporter n=1 Tax=uncultured Gulosibacter sp. TaxID=1339167 RepID=UPI002889075B|nr:AI-2E family transporter [uncultured Gulosibacter sp.]
MADQGRLRQPETVQALWKDSIGIVATRALQGMLILAAATVVIWSLLQVSLVMTPLLLALIVSAALGPVVSWLENRGWPRVLGTITVLLGILLILAGAMWLVVAQIAGSWELLTERAVEGITHLVQWWNQTFPQFALNDANIEQGWAATREWLSNLNYGAVGSGVAASIGTVGLFVTGLVLFLVILFFFLKDGPQIWRFIIHPLQDAQHLRAELMGMRAVAVLGGYVRGTVIVAFVDALLIGVGLAVLQVPLALPLAVVVFICAFIPVVGATLAGVVASLVTLVTNGFWPAVVVVIIVVIVNQAEGNLLSPIVLGKQLALHELVVMLALTVGTVLGGIIGTLIAVPLTAVAWALIKAWNEPLPDLEADPDGSTMSERLRELREKAKKKPRRRTA